MIRLKILKTICFYTLLLSSTIASATDRYWIGNNSNKNWSATANWAAISGGAGGYSVPATLDKVYFNSGGLGEVILDADIDIQMLTMSTGYTGSINQNGKTIVVGVGGMILNDGIFTGTNANIGVNGVFNLGGTNFTSTSGILQIAGNYTKTGGTFLHNNGNVRFLGTLSMTGSTDFYYLNFYSGTVGTQITLDPASTFNVSGRFEDSGGSLVKIMGGSLNVQGDILQTNLYANGGGTATININGTGNQLWTGHTVAPVSSYLCNIKINKSGGVLTLKNAVSLAGTWEYVSGAVDDTTYNATVCFPLGSSHTIKGTQTINKLYLGTYGAGASLSVTTGSVLTIKKSLTTSQKMVGFYGTIKLLGDFYTEGNVLIPNAAIGSGVIEFCGTGDQILSGTTVKGGGMMGRASSIHILQ